MKKSSKVTLTILTAAAAAAIAGCDSATQAQVQRCVDEHNVMVDERNCYAPTGGGYGGSGYYSPSRYRWVYGGNGGYTPGSVVYGASNFPESGLGTVRASELASHGYHEGGGHVGISSTGGFTAPSSRGGFGSTGHSMSGGHGAGE